MEKNLLKNSLIRVTVVAFLYAFLFLLCPATNLQLEVVNAATSYPVQEVKFGIGDTDRNVCISSTSSGSSLTSSTTTGEQDEKWYLTYVSSGIYKIVNSETGYVLTMSGSSCYISSDTSSNAQKWRITGVQTDFEGQYLYYKIVNYSDSSKALTFSESTGTFSLTSYSGSIDQKFKLNCDGQEGFAANCNVSGGEKAGTIGGLLGATVYVDTVDELEDALDSTDPLTVVVTGNIDCKNAGYTRIRNNKTLVGSYSARTIQDCMLRTNNEYGTTGDEPSDNIIIRNIDFEAVNNQNKILVQIWSSRYIWIDHCDFNAQFTCSVSEVGKFIWINTPYESYMDAKDLDRSPDYITLSYNTFTNRYWTIAYGTQNSETSRCRTSIMYNTFDSCARRCPQIGNGTGHVYNNYYIGASSSSNLSSQVIAGEGSVILTENCRFVGLAGYEVAVDSAAAYKDNGSYTSKSSSTTPYLLTSTLSSCTSTSWTPSTSTYGYKLVTAYSSTNYDTKTFCTYYAGSFSSYNSIKYITDSALSSYVQKTYASPFLRSITISSSGSSYSTPAEGTYMIKNLNSGLYMDVAGGTAANGTNVQQWGASSASSYNTWKLVSAGNGYYYMYSQVGDGETYLLDVTSHSSANSANMEIYKKSSSTAQLFKFVLNSDGSYTILTKSSSDGKCVEVANSSTASGANVQQYEVNASSCQHWILERTDGIDTSKTYAFKNAASGLYLDVASGTAANGTNVQQWGASSFAGYNTWKFVDAGNGYYYIYSQVGDGNTYLLDVAYGSASSGTNIQIYQNTYCDAQLYKMQLNDDGTYTILTKASSCTSCVEVKDASTSSGANVQEWTLNGATCQNWILEEVDS